MPIVTLLIQEPIVRGIDGTDLNISNHKGNSISLKGFVFGPQPKPISLGGDYLVHLHKVEVIERDMQLFKIVNKNGEKLMTGYQVGMVDYATHRRIYRTEKNQKIITPQLKSESVKISPYNTFKVYRLTLEIIYPEIQDHEEAEWITVSIICNKRTLVAIATYDSDGIDPFPTSLCNIQQSIEGIKAPHKIRKKVNLMRVYKYKDTLYIEKCVGRITKIETTDLITKWCYYYYRENELTYQTTNPVVFSDYDNGFEKVQDGTYIHINSEGSVKPLYIAKKSKMYVWMDLNISFDLPFLPEQTNVYTFIIDKSGEAIPLSSDVSP